MQGAANASFLSYLTDLRNCDASVFSSVYRAHLSHPNLEVVFVRSDAPFYTAAKRVDGYTVVRQGSLEKHSFLQISTGSSRRRKWFPVPLKVPDNHPPAKVVCLTDE